MPDNPLDGLRPLFGGDARRALLIAGHFALAVGTPLSAQQAPGGRLPEPLCFPSNEPVTRIGMARAYVVALRRAAAADSLMAMVARNTSVGSATGDAAGHLADVLYALGRARDEYRCAARGMDPFLASRDTAFMDFATETRLAFETHATWVADLTSELKRKVGTTPRTLVAEAESMAELRRRRDALTHLTVLGSTGLTFILSEAGPSGKITRLALTRGQRDSLLASLAEVAAGSTNDAPSAARVLIEWLKQPWETR